jgi:hypothetical protein
LFSTTSANEFLALSIPVCYTRYLKWVIQAGQGRSDSLFCTLSFPLEPEESFRQGEVVRVLRGPFEGLDAVFERRLSAQGRVWVFLEWMSRRVAAELDVEDLLPPW